MTDDFITRKPGKKGTYGGYGGYYGRSLEHSLNRQHVKTAEQNSYNYKFRSQHPADPYQTIRAYSSIIDKISNDFQYKNDHLVRIPKEDYVIGGFNQITDTSKPVELINDNGKEYYIFYTPNMNSGYNKSIHEIKKGLDNLKTEIWKESTIEGNVISTANGKIKENKLYDDVKENNIDSLNKDLREKISGFVRASYSKYVNRKHPRPDVVTLIRANFNKENDYITKLLGDTNRYRPDFTEKSLPGMAASLRLADRVYGKYNKDKRTELQDLSQDGYVRIAYSPNEDRGYREYKLSKRGEDTIDKKLASTPYSVSSKIMNRLENGDVKTLYDVMKKSTEELKKKYEGQ